MAGERHHIIPRFLQKGFSSRIDKDEIFTWVYRKNTKPFESNTKNIYVERHYYGKKGELNADDNITDVEMNKFSPLIDLLRSGKYDFQSGRVEIAELIAHLSIRTKPVREGFQNMSKQTLGGIKDIFTEEKTIESVILNPNKELVENEFDKVLSDTSDERIAISLEIFNMFGIEKEDVKNLITENVYSFLQDEETKDEKKEFFKEFFSNLFDGSIDKLPESIRTGHIQSLAQNTVPKERVEKFQSLEWFIFDSNSPVILGDITCIFKPVGEDSFKPSCDIENVSQIYLPISSNQVLIGTAGLEEIETDVRILNEFFAKCSYEQFICSEKSDEKIDLIQLLGTNSSLVSDEEIENELKGIRTNIEAMGEENY